MTEIMHGKITAVIISLAMVFFFVSSAHGMDTVRVATGGFSPSVPPYFTVAKAALLKQGIEIEDVLMSSGSLSAQALASGQVKVVSTDFCRW